MSNGDDDDDELLDDLFHHQLSSTNKLDRDRGIELIRSRYLRDERFRRRLFDLIERSDGEQQKKNGWTFRYGLLCALSELVAECGVDVESVRKFLLGALEDKKEARVRLVAGEILGVLCSKQAGFYAQIEGHLLNSIQSYINGDLKRREAKRAYKKTLYGEDYSSDSGSGSGSSSGSELFEDMEAYLASQEEDLIDYEHEDNQEGVRVIEKLSVNASANAAKLYRIMAGWRHLETSLKALQCCIEGDCKASRASTQLANEFTVLKLIFETAINKNRHIREASFNVINSIVTAIKLANESNSELIAQHLAFGLSDSWSQVRLAASVATRSFLLADPSHLSEAYLKHLLPCMCLNRYYLAEGVKLYSQDSWLMVFKTEGRSFVENYLQYVVEYYLKQMSAHNTVTKEATCASIGELVSKINRDLLRSHVKQLFKALCEGFACESWTVRDASCLALGSLLLNYLNEFSDQEQTQTISLFFVNLGDSLQSVRQGAAIALANVLKAMDEAKAAVLLERLEKSFADAIESVNKQEVVPEASGSSGSCEKLYTPYTSMNAPNEVSQKKKVKRKHLLAAQPNHPVDQASCEDDIGIVTRNRVNQPWHLADGHLYLLYEMSSSASSNKQIKAFLNKQFDAILKLVKQRDYSEHVHVMESFCKLFTLIGKNLGKMDFKQQLEKFFEPVFYTLECNFEPAEFAANECLLSLAKFIGPNILQGRLENYDSRLSEKFQRVLMNEQRMNKH